MNWQKIDPYHWESACLRYTVCRAMMYDADVRGVWKYSAFKRAKAEAEAPLQLGPCCAELRTAVNRCRDDRLESEKKPSHNEPSHEVTEVNRHV